MAAVRAARAFIDGSRAPPASRLFALRRVALLLLLVGGAALFVERGWQQVQQRPAVAEAAASDHGGDCDTHLPRVPGFGYADDPNAVPLEVLTDDDVEPRVRSVPPAGERCPLPAALRGRRRIALITFANSALTRDIEVWLAHHLALGVDTVFVYEDDRRALHTDAQRVDAGVPSLRTRLAPFVRARRAVVLPTPTRLFYRALRDGAYHPLAFTNKTAFALWDTLQVFYVNQWHRAYGNCFDYALHIDVDEFVVVPGGVRHATGGAAPADGLLHEVAAIERALGDAGPPAVLRLHWLFMRGTEHERAFADRFVTEQATEAISNRMSFWTGKALTRTGVFRTLGMHWPRDRVLERADKLFLAAALRYAARVRGAPVAAAALRRAFDDVGRGALDCNVPRPLAAAAETPWARALPLVSAFGSLLVPRYLCRQQHALWASEWLAPGELRTAPGAELYARWNADDEPQRRAHLLLYHYRHATLEDVFHRDVLRQNEHAFDVGDAPFAAGAGPLPLPRWTLRVANNNIAKLRNQTRDGAGSEHRRLADADALRRLVLALLERVGYDTRPPLHRRTPLTPACAKRFAYDDYFSLGRALRTVRAQMLPLKRARGT